MNLGAFRQIIVVNEVQNYEVEGIVDIKYQHHVIASEDWLHSRQVSTSSCLIRAKCYGWKCETENSDPANRPNQWLQGRCLAFWSRDAKGHLNAASWHGGAAVFSTNTASGKWTLQMLEKKWDRPGIHRKLCMYRFTIQNNIHIHIHTYTYFIYIHIRIHTYTYSYTYIFIYMHACMHTYIQTYIIYPTV